MKPLSPAMKQALREAERGELRRMINNPTIRGLLWRGFIEERKLVNGDRASLLLHWTLTGAGRALLCGAGGKSWKTG
jgi:hypothetical protein